jgi:protein-disulfide isomerase
MEGRRAGVIGTPTIFVNGRRHVIPDYSDTVLEFVLEDEEEWAKSGWKD